MITTTSSTKMQHLDPVHAFPKQHTHTDAYTYAKHARAQTHRLSSEQKSGETRRKRHNTSYIQTTSRRKQTAANNSCDTQSPARGLDPKIVARMMMMTRMIMTIPMTMKMTTVKTTVHDDDDNDDDHQKQNPTSGPRTRIRQHLQSSPREQKMALNHALGK